MNNKYFEEIEKKINLNIESMINVLLITEEEFTIKLLTYEILELVTKQLYNYNGTVFSVVEDKEYWYSHKLALNDGYINTNYTILLNMFMGCLKDLNEKFYFADRYAITSNIKIFESKTNSCITEKYIKGCNYQLFKFISILAYIALNSVIYKTKNKQFEINIGAYTATDESFMLNESYIFKDCQNSNDMKKSIINYNGEEFLKEAIKSLKNKKAYKELKESREREHVLNPIYYRDLMSSKIKESELESIKIKFYKEYDFYKNKESNIRILDYAKKEFEIYYSECKNSSNRLKN